MIHQIYIRFETKKTSVSCEVEESKTHENLHNPSGLRPVWNPQTSVSCKVEDAKTLETLHDPSGLHPVQNPQTSMSCGVEETKNQRDFT